MVERRGKEGGWDINVEKRVLGREGRQEREVKKEEYYISSCTRRHCFLVN